MTDDQHGEGTPQGGGRWDPLPQGDYDDGATAFVKLPEGGIDALLAADSPLAAPGHGYVPPRITAMPPASAETDPAATGTWGVPGAPADGAQWHDPNSADQRHGSGTASGAAPGHHAGHSGHEEGDRFTYHPGATGQWTFEEPTASEPSAPAPGHDVTGQWSIPVAGGDLPDESGEFTTSSLVEQWGGTPPATLPGGAPAPWATPQTTGQPWGQDAPGAGSPPEQTGAGHEQPPAAGHAPGQPGPTGLTPDHAGAGGHAQRQGADTPTTGEPGPGGPSHEQPPSGNVRETSGPPGHGPDAFEGAGHTPEPPAAPTRQGPPEPYADASGEAAGRYADASGEAAGRYADASGEAAGRYADASGEAAGRYADAPADSAGRYAEALAKSAGPYADAPAKSVRPDAEERGEASPDSAPVTSPSAREGSRPAPWAGEAPEDARGAVEATEGTAEPSAGPAPAAHPEPGPDAAEGPAPASASQTPGERAPAPGDAAPASAHEQASASPETAHEPAAPPHEEHPLASYVLRVNGTDRPVSDAWIGESLLYVLRERLGLAGAKDGCSQGECGACNVQVDGRLVASCLVPAVTAARSEVRTVEGLAADGQPSDVQRALARCGAVQCGFCVPGMAMTVHDLLEGNPAPTELETRQALCGNLCRCSGYRGVVEAVKEVVAERETHAASDEAEPEADEPRIPHQAGPGAGGVHPSAFESPHDQPYGQDGGHA